MPRGRPRTVDATNADNNQRGKYQLGWDPGEANPKQKAFFAARTPFIGYGGAKGGGKTWAVRVKAVGGAIANPGIRILIMRRTYPELEENHIQPILRMVDQQIGKYNGTTRVMYFFNGSTIKFGHWSGDQSELEYQGLEFDWIFIDEATQFTERSFNYLKGCLRGTTPYQKRMYITCNPGGVGHRWVKRLFIDKDYITDPKNPEGDERPEDYTFIAATVEDSGQRTASLCRTRRTAFWTAPCRTSGSRSLSRPRTSGALRRTQAAPWRRYSCSTASTS